MTRAARSAGVGVALGLLLSAALALAAPAAPVSAHATVVSTAPANGEELDARPAEVRVVFDEPVTPGSAEVASVIDEEGSRVGDGTAVLDDTGTTLTIPLPADLPTGSYIASWSVVSADTHPVGGSIQFGYGVPASAAAAPPAPEPSPLLTLAVGGAKGLLYLALVLALGVFPAAVVLGADGRERRAAVRVGRVGAAIGILASAGQLVLQALWVVSATAGDPWQAVAQLATASYGTAIGIRILVLVAVAAVLGTSQARLRLLAIAALGVVVVATVVLNGHGGAAPSWVFLSTALHAAAAICWLGGLVQLGWLLLRRRLTAERMARMANWSLYAGIAAAVLVASGLAQSIDEVGYPGALISTTYGVILSVKVTLVAAALALGFWGRWWIRRAAEHPDGRPAAGRTAELRTRVRWESGLTASVVIVSGVLSSITPARDDYAPTATTTTAIGPYEVTVEVAPARVGPQSFRVSVLPPTANSPQPASLQLVLKEEDGPVTALDVEFPYRIPGTLRPGRPTTATFVSSSVAVPTPGVWDAAVTIVVDEVEQYSGDVQYTVQ